MGTLLEQHLTKTNSFNAMVVYVDEGMETSFLNPANISQQFSTFDFDSVFFIWPNPVSLCPLTISKKRTVQSK